MQTASGSTGRSAETPGALGRGIEIDDNRFYTEDDLRLAGFTSVQLAKARESGELRFRQIGQRQRFYLGAWLREWLRGKP